MIFLDGVYLPVEGGGAGIPPRAGADGAELHELVQQIAERIGRVLEKRGLIERDMENAWLAARVRRAAG
jgi:hypothetical protein